MFSGLNCKVLFHPNQPFLAQRWWGRDCSPSGRGREAEARIPPGSRIYPATESSVIRRSVFLA